jgi:hypothetical protein
MSKQEQFIASIAPHAQEIQRKYGVPASIAIAQAALESGWGDSAKGNNLFGIKAGKSWQGATIDMATHEYINAAVVNADNAHEAADALQRAGYATDPKYASKLKEIINTNDLTRFDDASYKGYTEGERFEKTRTRLHEQREANPEPWADFKKFFDVLVAGIFSTIAAMLGISDDKPSSPPATPNASRVAGAEKATAPIRG